MRRPGTAETVADLVARLDELADDLTIYAEGGSSAGAGSRAVAVIGPEGGEFVLAEDPELHYLLEVDLAREAVQVWSAWRDGREPTLEERCEAILHYARNDAYLRPPEDLELRGFDLYGWRSITMDAATAAVAEALDVRFGPRDGPPWGRYFSTGLPGRERFEVTPNRDADGGPAEPSFPEYAVLLHVQDTTRSDELRAALARVAGLEHLRSEQREV